MPYSSAKNLCRQYNELRFIDVDLILLNRPPIGSRLMRPQALLIEQDFD